jgi:Mn2+/Fe2+ NRAMP family transporter
LPAGVMVAAWLARRAPLPRALVTSARSASGMVCRTVGYLSSDIGTRRGLADLIRERWGVRTSVLIFGALFFANVACTVTDLAAVKTTSALFNLPAIPAVIVVVAFTFFFITRGNYRQTEKIMLFSSLFFLTYVVSAVMAKPDWGLAISNLFYPHGAEATPDYLRNYLIIGMGVLGTTITPWGQFFISSFAYDKKIERGKVSYSEIETYVGAFITDFFSFFMLVATAATLFVRKIPLTDGTTAAMAIAPFAGRLAGILFAVGILNAGFMGFVVISLSTAYAFAEFFGIPGSLNDTYRESPTFYTLFLIQILLSLFIVILPGIDLFKVALFSQVVNAIALPLVLYFLIRLASDKSLMGEYANTKFQIYFSTISAVVIAIAAFFTVAAVFFPPK